MSRKRLDRVDVDTYLSIYQFCISTRFGCDFLALEFLMTERFVLINNFIII